MVGTPAFGPHLRVEILVGPVTRLKKSLPFNQARTPSILD